MAENKKTQTTPLFDEYMDSRRHFGMHRIIEGGLGTFGTGLGKYNLEEIDFSGANYDSRSQEALVLGTGGRWTECAVGFWRHDVGRIRKQHGFILRNGVIHDKVEGPYYGGMFIDAVGDAEELVRKIAEEKIVSVVETRATINGRDYDALTAVGAPASNLMDYLKSELLD